MSTAHFQVNIQELVVIVGFHVFDMANVSRRTETLLGVPSS
jgi:hypothetical protein